MPKPSRFTSHDDYITWFFETGVLLRRAIDRVATEIDLSSC